ncbi:MAG: fatty acid desaturase [Chitinophagaceae bacterium]|jgi:sphingolipid delta-4 desaturase
MSNKLQFIFTARPEPHRDRTKEILKTHPEVRKLIGKNPVTFLYILLLVSVQILLAILLYNQSWWLVVGIAYLIGAFLDHSLFVLIHECTHKLVFKSPVANKLASIFANLPLVFASAISFEIYHIKHHSFQGVEDLDGDLPTEGEAKLINKYFIGKAIWLLLYPFWQLFRLAKLKEIKAFTPWVAFNWLVQILAIGALYYFFGWKTVIYLLISFFFSVGLHPLGARWIQEHFITFGDEQETYSYYGNFNSIAFNVGYHNEHHDFPSVPWNKLPLIKQTANEYYSNLHSHNSWIKLWVRFLFDQEITLFSRVKRKNRNKVPLHDESKPDVELIDAGA